MKLARGLKTVRSMPRSFIRRSWLPAMDSRSASSLIRSSEGLGLAAGQTVNVSFNGVSGAAVVKVDETVPTGVALIPRSMGLAIREPVAVKVKS